MKIRALIFGLLLTVVAALQVNADPSRLINYQGRLVDTNGVPLPNGNYDMTFKIYDALTLGTLLWTEAHTGAAQVTVTNGLFSTVLGSSTALIDFNSTPYYIEITVGATVYTPRKQLTGAPFAVNSDLLDGHTTTYFQREITGSCGAGSSIRVINDDGTVTCQTDAGATGHGALSGLGNDDHTQYVHISTVRTITAQHSFAPTVAQAPFTLGGNAQGQLVTGLNADLLDGHDTAYFQREITGSCVAGQSIRVVNDDGTVTCEVDDNTDTQCDDASCLQLYLDGTGNDKIDTAAAAGAPTNANIYWGNQLILLGNTSHSGDVSGVYSNLQLGSGVVGAAEVADNSLAATDLAVNVVSSVDGVTNDGGNIDLIAGNGVTLTPDDALNQITVAVQGAGAWDAWVDETGDSMSGALSISMASGPALSVTNNSASAHVASFIGGPDDTAYEWVGFYSGASRLGIFLWDGAWGECLANEFCITGEAGPLALDSNGTIYMRDAVDFENNSIVDIDWSTSDDGSGSGLDADLLDGYHETTFFQLAQSETVTGIPAFNGGTSGVSAPFTADSTFKVTNLNADLLDGYDWSNVPNGTDIWVNEGGDTMTGNLVMSAADVDFSEDLGDKVLLYGGAGAAGSYTNGIESSTYYWRTGQFYRWYGAIAADGGASEDMELDTTNNRLIFQNKDAIGYGDSWLRINEGKTFTSGTWFGGMAWEGTYLAIGSNGGTTTSDVYIKGTFDATNNIAIDGDAGTIWTSSYTRADGGHMVNTNLNYGAGGTVHRTCSKKAISSNCAATFGFTTNACPNGYIITGWSRGGTYNGNIQDNDSTCTATGYIYCCDADWN